MHGNLPTVRWDNVQISKLTANGIATIRPVGWRNCETFRDKYIRNKPHTFLDQIYCFHVCCVRKSTNGPIPSIHKHDNAHHNILIMRRTDGSMETTLYGNHRRRSVLKLKNNSTWHLKIGVHAMFHRADTQCGTQHGNKGNLDCSGYLQPRTSKIFHHRLYSRKTEDKYQQHQVDRAISIHTGSFWNSRTQSTSTGSRNRP